MTIEEMVVNMADREKLSFSRERVDGKDALSVSIESSSGLRAEATIDLHECRLDDKLEMALTSTVRWLIDTCRANSGPAG